MEQTLQVQLHVLGSSGAFYPTKTSSAAYSNKTNSSPRHKKHTSSSIHRVTTSVFREERGRPRPPSSRGGGGLARNHPSSSESSKRAGGSCEHKATSRPVQLSYKQSFSPKVTNKTTKRNTKKSKPAAGTSMNGSATGRLAANGQAAVVKDKEKQEPDRVRDEKTIGEGKREIMSHEELPSKNTSSLDHPVKQEQVHTVMPQVESALASGLNGNLSCGGGNCCCSDLEDDVFEDALSNLPSRCSSTSSSAFHTPLSTRSQSPVNRHIVSPFDQSLSTSSSTLSCESSLNRVCDSLQKVLNDQQCLSNSETTILSTSPTTKETLTCDSHVTSCDSHVTILADLESDHTPSYCPVSFTHNSVLTTSSSTQDSNKEEQRASHLPNIPSDRTANGGDNIFQMYVGDLELTIDSAKDCREDVDFEVCSTKVHIHDLDHDEVYDSGCSMSIGSPIKASLDRKRPEVLHVTSHSSLAPLTNSSKQNGHLQTSIHHNSFDFSSLSSASPQSSVYSHSSSPPLVLSPSPTPPHEHQHNGLETVPSNNSSDVVRSFIANGSSYNPTEKESLNQENGGEAGDDVSFQEEWPMFDTTGLPNGCSDLGSRTTMPPFPMYPPPPSLPPPTSGGGLFPVGALPPHLVPPPLYPSALMSPPPPPFVMMAPPHNHYPPPSTTATAAGTGGSTQDGDNSNNNTTTTTPKQQQQSSSSSTQDPTRMDPQSYMASITSHIRTQLELLHRYHQHQQQQQQLVPPFFGFTHHHPPPPPPPSFRPHPPTGPTGFMGFYPPTTTTSPGFDWTPEFTANPEPPVPPTSEPSPPPPCTAATDDVSDGVSGDNDGLPLLQQTSPPHSPPSHHQSCEDNPQPLSEDIKDEPSTEKHTTSSTSIEVPKPICEFYPLNDSWVVWYDRITGRGRNKLSDYRNSLNRVCTIRCVEDFWRLYNNIKPPSELTVNANYHFFKEGIDPMWEDPANKSGGQWVLTISMKEGSQTMDNIWREVLLALVGGGMNNSQLINGVVLSRRKNGNRIALWTSKKTKKTNLDICKDLLKALCYGYEGSIDRLPQFVRQLTDSKSMIFGFKHHGDSLKSGHSHHTDFHITLKDHVEEILQDIDCGV